MLHFANKMQGCHFAEQNAPIKKKVQIKECVCKT